MTNASLSDTKFTVSMHPTLVDELDEGFSPMDGIVAIDEMYSELPLLHERLAPRRLSKRRTLKVYRGCYDWYSNLGFSYVQLGTTLHVLELWYEKNPKRGEMDVVLGQGETEGYEPFKIKSLKTPKDNNIHANGTGGPRSCRSVIGRQPASEIPMAAAITLPDFSLAELGSSFAAPSP